jgi:hypothetical protein
MRCDAAPQCRAHPRTGPVRWSPRRPCSHAAQATRLPQVGTTPRDASFLSCATCCSSPSEPYACVPRTGRTADPSRAPPYVRRPRLRRTTVESKPSPRRHRRTSALYKAANFPPRARHHRSYPLHHAIMTAAAELAFPRLFQCRVNSLGVSPSSLGPNHTTPCPGRAPSRRQHHPPRPPPPVPAVRPRRRPLRPNFGHHRALGEHVVEPHHLPNREHRRFARIGRSRAAGQGSHCESPLLSRVCCAI